MTSIESAQRDVAKLQATLTSVQTGLDTLEVAAEAARDARVGLRRAIRLVLVFALIGAVVVVVTKRSRRDDPVTPSPADTSVTGVV